MYVDKSREDMRRGHVQFFPLEGALLLGVDAANGLSWFEDLFYFHSPCVTGAIFYLPRIRQLVLV